MKGIKYNARKETNINEHNTKLKKSKYNTRNEMKKEKKMTYHIIKQNKSKENKRKK